MHRWQDKKNQARGLVFDTPGIGTGRWGIN